MKYVWWMNMSTGVEAMKMPLNPPMTNMRHEREGRSTSAS